MVATDLSRSIAEQDASGYRPRRNAALVLPVLGLHVAVLALVAATHIGGTAPLPASKQLLMFDVAAAPQAPAVKPTVKVVAPTLPVENLAPIVEAIAPTMVTAVADLEPIPTGGCDLTDAVQSTLRESPIARQAVAMLPMGDRSVANAVMVWDGNWIDAGTDIGRAALMQLREVMTETVEASSIECRTQLQAGPRLIALPGTPDVTLALGSGRWRWGDLEATHIAMAGGDASAKAALN